MQIRDGGAAPRLWPPALAAASGSALVGLMPFLARHLYADGIGVPSMLVWRYALALVPLGAAVWLARLDFRAAWRNGAWRIAVLGATLGAGQTLCFWESIKTLDTSVAELLFYTYPALALVLERVGFGSAIRPLAVACVALILCGAGLITAPGLRAGMLDPHGLAWALPSPLIYAVYLVITSTLLRRHPPLVGATCLYLGLTATFGIGALFAGLDLPATADGWGLLLLVAIGPGALTVTLFSYSVPRLGASSYAIIANVELVTVVAIGVLVLREPVTIARAAGGGLIVAGIVIRGLSLRRRAPTRVAPLRFPPPPAGEGQGGGVG
jgi:drug/metabolite transporter (DMT)-like permease